MRVKHAKPIPYVIVFIIFYNYLFFKTKNDSSDRTELVMLITPRVLDSDDKWDNFREELKNEVKFLTIE